MPQHGAERRDAGTAGDEQKRALNRLIGEGETPARALDPDGLAAAERLEVFAPSFVRIDLDQEFNVAMRKRVLRRRCDRERAGCGRFSRPDLCRLPGEIRELAVNFE